MTCIRLVYKNRKAYVACDIEWAWRSFFSFRAFQMQFIYICAAQQFTRFQLARPRRAVPQWQLGFLFNMAAVHPLGLIERIFAPTTKGTCWSPSFIQNLAEIDPTVLIICNFSYFAGLAWKCLFHNPKMGVSGEFDPLNEKWWQRNPLKACSCTETRHVTYRSSKSVKWLRRYQIFFSIFSRWRPSTILNLWNVYLEHPQRELGGLYRCAKFGKNRPSSFDNMQIFLFCHFGLKMPICTPKMGFLGEFDTLNGKW